MTQNVANRLDVKSKKSVYLEYWGVVSPRLIAYLKMTSQMDYSGK